ncbi:MAG: hypothetical protein M5U07_18535 [Xanthobacteraceae bacterium]|nr:hypothetical protein [Xanthobacteraceae bacterium]
MAIDYEAEYNNRARVPGHPQIFARWEKDSADYREAMRREDSLELGLKYGPVIYSRPRIPAPEGRTWVRGCGLRHRDG